MGRNYWSGTSSSLCSKRDAPAVRSLHATREQLPLTTTRESQSAATKTQHSQKLIKKKKKTTFIQLCPILSQLETKWYHVLSCQMLRICLGVNSMSPKRSRSQNGIRRWKAGCVLKRLYHTGHPRLGLALGEPANSQTPAGRTRFQRLWGLSLRHSSRAVRSGSRQSKSQVGSNRLWEAVCLALAENKDSTRRFLLCRRLCNLNRTGPMAIPFTVQGNQPRASLAAFSPTSCYTCRSPRVRSKNQ